MKLLYFVAALSMLLATGAAHAEIFKCIGEDGRTTYTNAKTDKGCKALPSDLPVSSVPSNAPAKKAAPTPANFPKVDGDTQRARDSDRRRILEQELATEQKSLDQATKDLGEAEADPETFRTKSGGIGRNVAAYDAKVKPLQDKVGLHERNIEALKKEIGNLR